MYIYNKKIEIGSSTARSFFQGIGFGPSDAVDGTGLAKVAGVAPAIDWSDRRDFARFFLLMSDNIAQFDSA